MHLSEVARRIGAEYSGQDVSFAAVSSDSRSIGRGELFVALHGPSFDAHDFISSAVERGACAAMIDRPVDVGLPTLNVRDTHDGLGELAAAWRNCFDVPVLAITGSNGKTTVKEMIGTILSGRGEVLVTRGNLNNDIGLPLTLLRLQDQHRFAVLEMGANHAGEIAYLTKRARPDIALITNAGAAHLEGFGSLQGVVQAKGEIIEGLAPDGVVVLNAEDAGLSYWRQCAGNHRVITFGLNVTADVSAASQSGSVTISGSGGESATLKLALPGRHSLMNALAAIAACRECGVSLKESCVALEKMQPVGGRLHLRETNSGLRVLDDTYNANPSSLQVALDVLVGLPGEHALVLGDMAELGEDAMAAHEQAGKAARAAGVLRLYAVGDGASAAANAFGDAGFAYTSREALVKDVLRQESGVVLVKGSRMMHLEEVVEALISGKAARANGGGC
ncbi:MAG TPA: UDP-N-acetylmuramoyl-tripeptide--D-alanyl-D-alanine ligase [Gammaproteobacteria bacterium]|nr:UDP-N-acetylmuramoyl-tripeptide--D-alanyl-D-alanine ligase [Gammaproteobacteria bacterium]